MLKLIGALLVIIASTAYGFYKATIYSKRLVQLQQLIYSLQRLKTAIQFGLTPLPEAFLQTSTQSTEPFGSFYINLHKRLSEGAAEGSFVEIWQSELYSLSYTCELKPQHFDILQQLGTVLGTSDIDDQEKHLQAAIERFLLEEAISKDEQVKYSSLWRSLGALTGAALVILLI